RSIVSKLRLMPKTRSLSAGLLVALGTACSSRGAERTLLATRVPVARLDSVLKAADSVRLPLGTARILSGVAAESGLAARTPHDTMTIGEILTWARAEQARKKQVDVAAAAAERARQGRRGASPLASSASIRSASPISGCATRPSTR